ncbi:S8 family serine peptidase [Planctomycetota bacterium]
MRQTSFVISFILCLSAILGSVAFGAGADSLQLENVLQPQGLQRTGIYALRQIYPNLTGAGVKFGIICRSITYIDGEPQNDCRPDIRHNCFKNKDLNFQYSEASFAGISPHSTAICSILFGEDPEAFHPDMGPFYYEGSVPRAQAEIHEFWNFVLKHVYTQEPPDADILTASFGIEFEYPWTRGIELLAESYGIVVVASIGNGADAHNPVLYPAAGANVIGVGVVNSVNTEDLVTNLTHFALPDPEHSSPGPTGNGRCKPDLVAPANCLAVRISASGGSCV